MTKISEAIAFAVQAIHEHGPLTTSQLYNLQPKHLPTTSSNHIQGAVRQNYIKPTGSSRYKTYHLASRGLEFINNPESFEVVPYGKSKLGRPTKSNTLSKTQSTPPDKTKSAFLNDWRNPDVQALVNDLQARLKTIHDRDVAILENINAIADSYGFKLVPKQ